MINSPRFLLLRFLPTICPISIKNNTEKGRRLPSFFCALSFDDHIFGYDVALLIQSPDGFHIKIIGSTPAFHKQKAPFRSHFLPSCFPGKEFHFHLTDPVVLS